jgi:hypothetical protein
MFCNFGDPHARVIEVLIGQMHSDLMQQAAETCSFGFQSAPQRANAHSEECGAGLDCSTARRQQEQNGLLNLLRQTSLLGTLGGFNEFTCVLRHRAIRALTGTVGARSAFSAFIA